MTDVKESCWLDDQHPEYSVNISRWRFADDMYTGEALDAGKVASYLVRKNQAERGPAFEERCKLADLTPHFSVLVDSLAGMLFSVEEKATRQFSDEHGNGLGDPEDVNTIIGRLYQDVDGRGNGWPTMWRDAAIRLIHTHKIWIFTDSVDELSRVRIIPPTSVPNWIYDDLGLKEVLVKESVDQRKGLESRGGFGERWVQFTREGWQRWRKETDEEGNVKAIKDGEPGFYEYWSPDGKPILPIFEVKLPMRRQVGWLMAKKANAMFNKESERDTLIRSGNFAILNLVADDDLFTKLLAQLKSGTRALQNKPENTQLHTFIAPDGAPAEISTKVLEQKREEFYITGFREYGDAAKERTATEVRQDVSHGVGAFLQHLKTAVDDAENGALWRIEQIEYPSERSKWGLATVVRSDDFSAIDPQAIASKLAERYFGKDRNVPIGKSGLLSIAKKISSMDGFAVDDLELAAAITMSSISENMDAFGSLPFPAEARAQMAVDMLIGLGYLNPQEEIETEGEDKILKKDEIYRQALIIAQAEDQRERDFLEGSRVEV